MISSPRRASVKLATAVDLHTELVGDGPTILMMHGGLGLDHTYLRAAHDPLGESFRLVYYDHRANGRSTRQVGHADHATWHADASALLDTLGEHRAIIYGHSYGAWLALGYAIAYPDRVAGLVLCCVSAAFDYVSEVLAHVHAGPSAISQRFLALLATPPATDAAFGAAWLEILPLYFRGQVRAEMFARTAYSAEGHVLGTASLATYNVRERLPELRVPTLVVAGVHDFITPLREARAVASGIAGAELVELRESGHFPFAEEPAAYRVAVTNWLQRFL